MKNFERFQEIVNGWKNYIFPSANMEKLAKARIAHCVDCEKFRANSTCSICNCFMPAKARNEGSKCPLKKW